MSRELRCPFQGSAANLYAIVRRLSDGHVWSTVTSAFAAFADLSIADYDVALTDRGGDYYDGDFPSAITAGNYRVDYYERAGAAPATTDLRLRGEEFYWNGASVSSVSAIALSAYALTGLENQKRFMRITDSDDDTLLTQLINGVSAEIEAVGNVQIVARDRRERLNGNGQRRLTLKHRPVIDFFRLAWGAAPAVSVSYSGSDVRADVGVGTEAVRISSYSTAGAATTSRFLFADYPALSTLAAAIELVSGWTATVTENMPTADLNPLGGSDAKSRSVVLTYPDRGDVEYTVDHAAGLVELVHGIPGWSGGGHRPLLGRATGYEGRAVFPCGHQYLFCHYRAGHEVVPANIELLCNRFVQDAYDEGESSRGMTMASLGPFTWRANAEQVESVREAVAMAGFGDIAIGGV